MVLTFDKRQICSEHLQLRFNMIKNLLCLFLLNRFITMCNASVNPSCPLPPPGLPRGISPPFQSRGWGICKFCTARGPGICQPQGYSQAFDTLAVSYQNIATQWILLEKRQIGSSFKDSGLYRHILDFMHAFLHCLLSQNYIAKLGSYRRESTFSG